MEVLLDTQRIVQPCDRAGMAVFHDFGGLVVRILTDIIATNAGEIRDSVVSAWNDKGKPPKVILDLRGVNHIDSTGVGALMDLAQRARTAGIPLILCGLEDAPRRMLKRTGIAELFRISESVDEVSHI